MQKHFLKKYLGFFCFFFFLFSISLFAAIIHMHTAPSRGSRVHPCYGVGLIASFHSLFHFGLGWWRRISERIVIIHAWRVPQAMVVGGFWLGRVGLHLMGFWLNFDSRNHKIVWMAVAAGNKFVSFAISNVLKFLKKFAHPSICISNDDMQLSK